MITKDNIYEYVGKKAIFQGQLVEIADAVNIPTLPTKILVILSTNKGHNGSVHVSNLVINNEKSLINKYGSYKCWYVHYEDLQFENSEKTIPGHKLIAWAKSNPDYHNVSNVVSVISPEKQYTKGKSFLHMHNGKKFIAFNVEFNETIPIAFLREGFKDNVVKTNSEVKNNMCQKVAMADHIDIEITISTGSQEPIILNPRKGKRLIIADQF